MATKEFNLGKITWFPKGVWIEGTYDRFDHVTHQGNSYVSKVNNNTANPTDATKWDKITDDSKLSQLAGKFNFNLAFNPPTPESPDGIYFVKEADDVVQYLVSESKVYPLTSEEYFYGVVRDRNLADPSFKAIGNSNMHKILPLHAQILPCKVNEARQIVNYLNPTDWTKNLDGSPSVLDGSDGLDVMLRFPECWAIMDGGDDDEEVWAISNRPFAYKGEQAIHFKEFAVSPDYCTVDRTSNKSRCVQSEDANLAGSGLKYTDGGIGYPRTSVSRYNYELYAENKGEKWNNWLYGDYMLLQAFMYIEHKTRNLKSIYGSLGHNWSAANWVDYSNYNPVLKVLEAHKALSGTPEIVEKGSLTGVYTRTFTFTNRNDDEVTYETNFGVYRGMILWGHLWKWVSGLEYEVKATDDADSTTNIYVQFNPDEIDKNRTDYNFDFKDNYQLMGQAERRSMWVKKTNARSGQVKEGTGAETTFSCQYFWASIHATGAPYRRGVSLSGALHYGSNCAVGSANSNYAPSREIASYGSGFRCEIEN